MGTDVQAMEGNLELNRLHTICQEACCPNQGECFSKGVATFLILGKVFSRLNLILGLLLRIFSPLLRLIVFRFLIASQLFCFFQQLLLGFNLLL